MFFNIKKEVDVTHGPEEIVMFPMGEIKVQTVTDLLYYTFDDISH